MSSETATSTVPETRFGWKGGAAAGLIAGTVMGVMLTVMMTPVIQRAIPAMYGLAVGWLARPFHAAVLGVVFAVLARSVGVEDDPVRSAVLWVALAAFVMPVWLGAVGFPGVPPLPNFNPMSLVGHLVYGAVLGAAYSPLADL